MTFGIKARWPKRADWMVTHWRYGLSLASKCCEGSGHSQICVGDVAKDLARWEQDVGAAHVLAYGHEIVVFRGNVTNDLGMNV